MFTLAILPVVLLAAAASEAIVARSSLVRLLARQATGFDPSQIPSQCQPDCTIITNALSSSSCATDVNCICGSSTRTGLYTCLECALKLDPDQSVLNEAQANYNAYIQACKQAGADLVSESLTIPSGASTVVQVSFSPVSSGAVTAIGLAPSTTAVAVTQTGSQAPVQSATRNSASLSGVAVSSAGLIGAVGAFALMLAL
ncbi:hypothetical protein BD414DRAFT_495578 [Trametes punicea]|nr:hypothetical protein BD414DRAFT_495578 [Trametes punicea]